MNTYDPRIAIRTALLGYVIAYLGKLAGHVPDSQGYELLGAAIGGLYDYLAFLAKSKWDARKK